MFVITMNTDDGPETFEIITDADEKVLNNLFKIYMSKVALNHERGEEIPGLVELFNKEGYYCSYNLSSTNFT
jgi:hypothetical protein